MTEIWYVFDLDPHLDPNFVEWLRLRGINLRFNCDGRRGAIAQDPCDIPPLPPESYPTDDIPRITVEESECIPDDLSPYFEEGKKTKAYSTRQLHCGYSNFGRQKPEPPKCNDPECLEYWRKISARTVSTN